ncbi:hypothetical protein [Ornithinimicrobium cryptoxanthini]|uniref:Asparagine synthase (Glutamine-hydrolysing) n=1 Tax=Ornithinimicrobium cryptoxanthini TaxID=2934161 RepID=A0ABY4YHP8_9MICO|nr:hypothetical protein [Ornithinimicrobium cryptoxanthini]USQ76318.1 hypothetical protein NF557_17305 [Ornithinimicrobium cryptoxanthini]
MAQDQPVGHDALVVDGAFGCGYLVRAGTNTAPGLVAGWPVHKLGSLTYHLHPRTRLHAAVRDGGPGRVVILGHPVDVRAGLGDGDLICEDVLDSWTDQGLDAAVRHLAYLGGRWTAFLDAVVAPGEPGRVTVVPDCQATQAVFYSTYKGVALGSQPALVAQAVDTGPDEAAQRMWDALRKARRTGVIFHPGTMTTHEGVLPLVPNHLLRLSVAGAAVSVEHERFWPFQDRVERTDTRAVTSEFIDYFREHTRLLCDFGTPVISLTGGMDSRTSLAAALPHLHEDSFTFTYFNPRDGLTKKGAADDVFEANAIAFGVGVQHRVLRWRRPRRGSAFDEIIARTYPVQRASTGAAHAMWADLPHDIIHLQSIGAEVGTTFFTKRPEGPITADRLLEIVSTRADLGQEMARAAFGDYLDYAQFTHEAIRGYDPHDVFYWEQRMGKWGYQKFQDGDFSHRMLLPFNDRGLIELMQSLPYPQRESKVLLHALLATVPAPATPAPADEARIGWRDVVAARPHVRPRLARLRDRLPRRQTTQRSMP